MTVKIKPENFKPVARLLTHFKPGKVMRGRATIWDRLHRLVASEGQLKLFTTDGLSFLEWIIPHEGHMADAFEMPIDAEQFNNVALKLNDGDFLLISSANEYLTLIQGQRNLRMAWQSATAYPTPEQETGPLSEQSVTWTYPTAELSKALAFVATFINNNNKSAGRAVATLNTNHELTAGGAAKQASVVGLNATLQDVSLTQTAARQVSAFLGMLSEEVQITADDKHYTFTCPLNAHKLIVPRESPFQLAPLGRRTELDYEQVEVGREALASSTTFLATVVTAKAKPLEFWLRGGGEGAQLKIVTPHQLEAEKSEDTLPVLRTFHLAGEPATTREEVSVPPAEELKLQVDAEPLRGILTDMVGCSSTSLGKSCSSSRKTPASGLGSDVSPSSWSAPSLNPPASSPSSTRILGMTRHKLRCRRSLPKSQNSDTWWVPGSSKMTRSQHPASGTRRSHWLH